MMNSKVMEDTRAIQPIFFKHEDIVDIDNVSGLDICIAADQVIGDSGACEGSQLKRYPGGHGLWRVYLSTNMARAKLMAEGMSIGPCSITVYSQNPYATLNHDPDKKSIKVTVKDVPLSVANACITDAIKALGVEPPRLRDGYYRDPDGKLTKYKKRR